MSTPQNTVPPATARPGGPAEPRQRQQRISRGLTLLFAIAGGAAVANLYWAQPLLDFIARDLHASASLAGWLVTATQIGYAVGILLIVPLGDVMDRRRLIPLMMLIGAVALVGCALAPSIGVLLVAITALGVGTVSGQILAPLAGDLADDASRGRVVGTVAFGILIGTLISRMVSGLVASIAGWRAVFVVAAAAAVVFAVLLYRAIPSMEPKLRMPYPALIASVGRVVRQERMVRWTLVLGATGFSVFTMFWTALTFLLSAPPFSYPVSVIGLFGLAGLAGAMAAQGAGGSGSRLVAARHRSRVGPGPGRVRYRRARRPLRPRARGGHRVAGHRRHEPDHPQPDPAVRHVAAGPKQDQHRAGDQ